MKLGFSEFYQFDDNYKPELYEVDLSCGCRLDEVNKREFMNNTDKGRIKRAKTEIRTRPPQVTDVKDGYERIEYNFKAYPSTEFRRHWGYVDAKGNDIKEMFCDCKDFYYRLYAPMVKKGLATWNLSPKYQKRLDPAHYGGTQVPHNREWTKETNPDGKLFVCKHLYSLMSEYVSDDEPANEIIEKNKEKYKEQRKEMDKEAERQNQIDQAKRDKEKRDMEAQKRREQFKSTDTHQGSKEQEQSAEVDELIDDNEEE